MVKTCTWSICKSNSLTLVSRRTSGIKHGSQSRKYGLVNSMKEHSLQLRNLGCTLIKSLWLYWFKELFRLSMLTSFTRRIQQTWTMMKFMQKCVSVSERPSCRTCLDKHWVSAIIKVRRMLLLATTQTSLLVSLQMVSFSEVIQTVKICLDLPVPDFLIATPWMKKRSSASATTKRNSLSTKHSDRNSWTKSVSSVLTSNKSTKMSPKTSKEHSSMASSMLYKPDRKSEAQSDCQVSSKLKH